MGGGMILSQVLTSQSTVFQSCHHVKISLLNLWDFYPTWANDELKSCITSSSATEAQGSPSTSLAPMGGGIIPNLIKSNNSKQKTTSWLMSSQKHVYPLELPTKHMFTYMQICWIPWLETMLSHNSWLWHLAQTWCLVSSKFEVIDDQWVKKKN